MTIIVGTRINCVLRHAGRGIVYAIHGEQRPDTVSHAGGVFHRGGSATFDVVFDNGHKSLNLPECIIRGVQWSILPGIATDKEIAEALAYAAHVAANARKVAEDGIAKPTPETAFGSFVAVPGEQWDLGILIRLQAADMEGEEAARDDRQRGEGD